VAEDWRGVWQTHVSPQTEKEIRESQRRPRRRAKRRSRNEAVMAGQLPQRA
jgi:hypothetical protein